MAIQTINNGEAGSSIRNKLNSAIGQLNLIPPISNEGLNNFNVFSNHNVIEQGLTQCTIGGGGTDAGKNKIGDKTKPYYTDFAPTDWANDSGYVDQSAHYSLIAGGYDHVANQIAGVIVGGGHNFIKYNLGGHSIIGGGGYNLISGGICGIFGGSINTITGTTTEHSFIVGGYDNNIIGNYSFIGGGKTNNLNGNCSGINSGLENAITGNYSFIGGGFKNKINAGYFVGILGGYNNRINNCSQSFAIGSNIVLSADGIVALSDIQSDDFVCATVNKFYARFANGYSLNGVPTYSDNASAIAAGLVAHDIYKTATGELRIVI